MSVEPLFQDDFAGLEQFLPELIPDGALPLNAVVVVEYLTADGETIHGYETIGEGRGIQSIGLLEVGKLMIWDDYQGDE